MRIYEDIFHQHKKRTRVDVSHNQWASLRDDPIVTSGPGDVEIFLGQFECDTIFEHLFFQVGQFS